MGNQLENDTKQEIYAYAKPLITKYHSHLIDAQVLFIWRENELKNKGETVYGEAKRTNDALKHFSGADFLITVYKYGWDKFLMPEKKVALIDHLLSHCKVGIDANGFPKADKFGDPMWLLVKPDAAMFYDVVSRHGAWNEEVEAVFNIMKKKLGDSIKKAATKVTK